MRPLDFWIMMLCCLAWGGNFVIGAWVLSSVAVPPFLLASVRAAMVLALTGIFLFKARPERFGLLLCVCATAGFIHLGFLYKGLQTAPAGGSSIVAQMLIPIATVLSVIFLKEKIGLIRATAIAAAFLGVCFMVYKPGALSFDWGLIYILLAYVSLAISSVMMKRVGKIDWRIYVAWTALIVFVGASVTSFFFEQDQISVIKNSYIPLLIAAGYAAIFISIFAHGQYFRLLQKYDVSVVVPLTPMMSIFGIILGILFLDEILYLRYIIGAAIILPCVYIIARRQTSGGVHNGE